VGVWFHCSFDVEGLIYIDVAVALDSCSIDSIDLIMEPTFAETASETVTTELRAQLDAVMAAIPPAHHLDPSGDEVFESKDVAFVRLQDWAFTKGFAMLQCRFIT
jgi:hypothetical protein